MRVVDRRTRVTRRDFLLTGSAATLVVGAASIACPTGSWAVEVKALKPETMRTLVQVSRDIFPHDQIDDRYYVIALEGTDKAAARDEDARLLIESGVVGLDKEARAIRGKPYIEIPEEEGRVMLLNAIQDGEFFQKIRSDLITGLYNNDKLWLKFGYEGESASKGGYLDRGFDDVDWV